MTAALPWESGAQAGVSAPLAGEPSLSVLICKWDHLPPGSPSSILRSIAKPRADSVKAKMPVLKAVTTKMGDSQWDSVPGLHTPRG